MYFAAIPFLGDFLKIFVFDMGWKGKEDCDKICDDGIY